MNKWKPPHPVYNKKNKQLQISFSNIKTKKPKATSTNFKTTISASKQNYPPILPSHKKIKRNISKIHNINKTKESSILKISNTTGNLYDQIIRKELRDVDNNINHQSNINNKTNANEDSYYPYELPKMKVKIILPPKNVELNKIVKNVVTKTNDIDDFANEMKEKHKHLFEELLPILCSGGIDEENISPIPKMLYDDVNYFKQRFKKVKENFPLQDNNFPDQNMVYPSLLDYKEYIYKMEDYLNSFKNEKYMENILNPKSTFYEDLLAKIIQNDNVPKFKETINSLRKNYFHFPLIKKRKPPKSILKKNGDIKEQSQTKQRKIYFHSHDLDNSFLADFSKAKINRNKIKYSIDINDLYNNNSINKDNSELKDSTFIGESLVSNSYIDNSFILDKDMNIKQMNGKFGLKIQKYGDLFKIKEKSLYEKYISSKLRNQLKYS